MTLNDICEFIVDCPHSTAKDEGAGYPLIRTPNVGRGRLILNEVHRVSERAYLKRNQRATPQDDDLIMAREAPAGNVAIIKNGEKVCLGQRTVLLRPDKTKAYPDYLVYYLLAPQQQYGLLGTANGATVAHVNIPVIKSLPVSLPSINEQKKIADILTAYDDLIENNQRQIKLLEEAAQRLYKEWFVDLRFPGHENVPVVDGVPEGWTVQSIADIAEINKDSIGKDYSYENIKYIDISSVTQGQIINKTTYELKDAPGRARRLAHDGDIIWSMVRPNLRSYALVQYPDENDVFSTGFAILSPKNVPFTYLYCVVTTNDFVGYLVNCTNGAAYPAVKPVHFEDAKIVIPESNLLQKFESLTIPMFRKIHQLKKENDYLSEARDHLLPKLMSGEIAV